MRCDLLIDLLIGDVQSVTNYIWLLFLIFARFLGAIVIHPLFSGDYLSKILRSSLALLLSIVVFPHYTTLELNIFWINKVILLFSNFVYGTVLGFFLAFPIWAIESCGKIIDIQRGEQAGAVISKLTNNPSSSSGKLLTWAFMVYFVMNNGLLFFIETIFNSFEAVPFNRILPILDLYHINQYIKLFGDYFYWVIILVLPVILGMLFIDILLGITSSFIPQLNVTVLSMPIKSTIGLFLLSMYLGSLFHNIFVKLIVNIKGIYV